MPITADIQPAQHTPIVNPVEYVIRTEEPLRQTNNSQELAFLRKNALVIAKSSYSTALKTQFSSELDFELELPILSNSISFFEEDCTNQEVEQLNKLIKAYKECTKSLVINNTNIDRVFYNVGNELSELPFEDIFIEIADQSRIKISLAFADKRLLIIDKYLDAESSGIGEESFVYTYFINRKMVASDVAEMQSFVKGFKKYLGMQGL
jgi:hypothetical protein